MDSAQMKIGDVMFYKEEQGVVEKIEGCAAYLRVFRETFEFRDWHHYSERSGFYSHITIKVDLVEYYRNKSFPSYLKYTILQILYEIKQEPLLALAMFLVLILGILALMLGIDLVITFLGTL